MEKHTDLVSMTRPTRDQIWYEFPGALWLATYWLAPQQLIATIVPAVSVVHARQIARH